jgi:splicing factor 3B subunit 1
VAGAPDATPVVKRSRWDQAPSLTAATPVGNQGLVTPMHPSSSSAPVPQMPLTFGLGDRNAPLSDEELDEMLPKEGYKILEPPPGYAPIRTPARKLTSTPAPMQSASGIGGFMMQEPENARILGKQMPTDIPGVGDLQFFKSEDMQYFGKLVDGADENQMTVEELKERKIMRLLLKVKNGTPPMRKTALRQLTDNARQFGAGPLFNQILPLLMEKTLEDQERHLLVKVIDRILYKLDDLVRPYTHKILVVIEPLLIDQDYYARVEGREIISNLSKAAGLAHMISTMRPDIDHVDEYVRNTTARAFAVVASALGIPALLPFLRAVCRSKKSWQARHTGVKIVQQIPILMGCAILPHLKGLVECIGPNLEDEQAKVRTVTSLAIAALAEAAHPYGIESFDTILQPLWTGAKKQRGKGLAGFLKAVGYVIPLMDEEYANYYTGEVMGIVLREFQSPDEEMKKVVLKVVSQCAGTEGVTAAYLKEHVLPEFFKAFWIRRMAVDKRNYRQVVETTVDLAQKVGCGEIVERIVDHLKDESEPYRKMSLESVEKVIASLGAADISERLEERLVDGVLYAFQEQSIEDIVMLNGFGTVVNALGTRTKPYLPQIVSTILWRLNNKSSAVRQQSADLISRIAVVMVKFIFLHILYICD